MLLASSTLTAPWETDKNIWLNGCETGSCAGLNTERICDDHSGWETKGLSHESAVWKVSGLLGGCGEGSPNYG